MSKETGANLPRAVDGTSAQALLIRFAVGLPIGASRHCRSIAYGISLSHLQRCRGIAR